MKSSTRTEFRVLSFSDKTKILRIFLLYRPLSSRSHLSLWGSLNIDIRPLPLLTGPSLSSFSLSLPRPWLTSWGNCPLCLIHFPSVFKLTFEQSVGLCLSTLQHPRTAHGPVVFDLASSSPSLPWPSEITYLGNTILSGFVQQIPTPASFCLLIFLWGGC